MGNEHHDNGDSRLRDIIDETRRSIAKMQADLDNIEKQLLSLVTRPEFTPVKIIVYGLVGSVLTGVIGAILSKVIMK